MFIDILIVSISSTVQLESLIRPICQLQRFSDLIAYFVGWSGAFIPIMTYETKSVFSETATHAEQNAFQSFEIGPPIPKL